MIKLKRFFLTSYSFEDISYSFFSFSFLLFFLPFHTFRKKKKFSKEQTIILFFTYSRNFIFLIELQFLLNLQCSYITDRKRLWNICITIYGWVIIIRIHLINKDLNISYEMLTLLFFNLLIFSPLLLASFFLSSTFSFILDLYLFSLLSLMIQHIMVLALKS